MGKSRTSTAVEKGFSSYVKMCLNRASRDFFRRHKREYQRLVPYEDIPEIVLSCSVTVYPFLHVEKYLTLEQAVQT